MSSLRLLFTAAPLFGALPLHAQPADALPAAGQSLLARTSPSSQPDASPKLFAPPRGIYNGLFYVAGGIEQQSSGAFTITTTTKGTLSGKLYLGSAYYPMSGSFDGSWSFTQTIRVRNRNLLTVRLQIDPADPRYHLRHGSGFRRELDRDAGR